MSQITTNLEEVVFEEVPHGLVSGNVPPGVEVEVQDVEPGDEDEGGELGLVADGDQHHEERAHQVLDDLHCRHLEAKEGEEHEDQEDPARKLQVHFRLVLPQTWHLRSRKTVESTITQRRKSHPSEQRLALNPGLGENQEKSSDERQISEKEL